MKTKTLHACCSSPLLLRQAFISIKQKTKFLNETSKSDAVREKGPYIFLSCRCILLCPRPERPRPPRAAAHPADLDHHGETNRRRSSARLRLGSQVDIPVALVQLQQQQRQRAWRGDRPSLCTRRCKITKLEPTQCLRDASPRQQYHRSTSRARRRQSGSGVRGQPSSTAWPAPAPRSGSSWLRPSTA